MYDLCIYHKGCMDGFGAAWTVHKWAVKKDIEVEYLPAIYGDALPDVTGREVIIVDFSYSRKVLMYLHDRAKSLVVLDHHDSAKKNCEGLEFAHFDTSKCGARMTWEWLFSNQDVPLFLQYIEDRDLWLWKMDYSRDINAAMYSYPMDFEVWDAWEDPMYLMSLVPEGQAINRSRDKMLESLVRGWMVDKAEIGGYTVPVVNCNHFFKSEVAQALAEGQPFAAIYFDSADKRNFDLRSVDGGVDVSEIARLYGGGGHERAAGFSIDKPGVI